MYILLDENNYFTGKYFNEYVEGSVKIEEIPNEHNLLKLKCYKYENDKLIFDKQKYDTIFVASLDVVKKSKIQDSKYALERWLNSHTLFSRCHNKEGENYTITQDKQTQLNQTISLAQLSIQTGLPFKILWNSTAGICEEWTIEELSILAFEISQYVRPRISEQQKYEYNVLNAKTLEEIESYKYNYDQF